jgi:hypothetical protein
MNAVQEESARKMLRVFLSYIIADELYAHKLLSFLHPGDV